MINNNSNSTSLKALRAVYGSNLEALAHSPSPYDKTLLKWFKSLSPERQALIEKCEPNRGDMGETALSGAPTNRTGKQVKSHGDILMITDNPEILRVYRDLLAHKPMPLEVKILTPKTKASAQLKGTTAKAYLIGFVLKDCLIFRLINSKDLSIKNGSINLQDNLNKGLAVDLNTLALSPID